MNTKPSLDPKIPNISKKDMKINSSLINSIFKNDIGYILKTQTDPLFNVIDLSFGLELSQAD